MGSVNIRHGVGWLLR